jgi:hypothetical protein
MNAAGRRAFAAVSLALRASRRRDVFGEMQQEEVDELGHGSVIEKD